MLPERSLHLAVALLVRPDGQALLVRKRGTRAFVQPGGKIEAGETASAALVRELREELTLDVAEDLLAPLGQASAAAVNEQGWTVHATIFGLRTALTPIAGAEIVELAWIDPGKPDGLAIAPLSRDHVLPLARDNSGGWLA
jgi:8-oxo-dGTP diphosphatase